MLVGNIQIINIYLIDVIASSPFFKSVRLASEEFPNERTVQTVRIDLPISRFVLQKPFIIFSFY